MLDRIKNILNTMGSALNFSDAGEMLTLEQKVAVLDRRKEPYPIAAADTKASRVVLAGNDEFSPQAVEHAIALCLEKRAMLDLLYVIPKSNGASIQLATVLLRLESETDLDFQVTRRHGDLLTVIDDYLIARRDTLMILIKVSDHLLDRAERCRRTGKWFRTAQLPTVQLIEDVIHA